MVRAEWKSRVDMAPFAEALGLSTDCIMSASSPDGGETWAILFTDTPTSDPAEWVHVAVLRPDARNILQVVRRTPFKTIAELNAGLAEHMEREMRKLDEKGETDG